MREFTKVPNLMASPASPTLDLRTKVSAAQSARILGQRLAAARLFAAKIRPDMQQQVRRFK